MGVTQFLPLNRLVALLGGMGEAVLRCPADPCTAGPAEQHSQGPGQATAWFAGGGLPGSVPVASGGRTGCEIQLGMVHVGAGSCCSLTQALPGPPRGGLTSAVPLAQAAGVAGPFIIGEVDEELTGGEMGGPPCFGLTLTCSCPGAPLSHPD